MKNSPRGRLSLARLIGGGVLLAWLALLGWESASAQVQAQPRPAVLLTVQAVDGGTAGGEVRLVFTPQIPRFTVTGNDTDHPEITLALSSRGDAATVPTALHGIVKSIDFLAGDNQLMLKLTATAPVHLAATTVGDKQLALVLTPVAKAAATVAQPAALIAGAPSLPHATEASADQDGFELVPLKYADVSEVVGLLTDGQTIMSNDNFTPHEPAFGSAGMNGGSVLSASLQANQDDMNRPVGQSVNDAIGVDRRLNAIILKGSPERIARLKAKIAAIDLPVQSVVLETQFVELTDTAARDIGLDYANSAGQLGVATYAAGGYIPPGFSTNKNLTSFALQAAIYAQVQAGRGRIVSKPRISAQSGGTAQIITGDALPILTAITLSGVNGVSQQVQYVNVGVTLQIAPRVSSDGFVTSHVFCVVSSVTGYSQGYPTISQREASTSATVQDGETFVIGGLTQENEISSKSKVPGLGDLPGAGELFKLGKSTKSKTELYIVVTPHVVRGPASAATLAMLGSQAAPAAVAAK